MAVTNEIFMLGVSILMYLALGITWDFHLFKANDKENNNNVVKTLIVWLLLWLQPLIAQNALEYAGDLSRSADIISLFTTYYQVTVWLAWVISIYFVVFFSYNVLLFLANVTKGGRRG